MKHSGYAQIPHLKASCSTLHLLFNLLALHLLRPDEAILSRFAHVDLFIWEKLVYTIGQLEYNAPRTALKYQSGIDFRGKGRAGALWGHPVDGRSVYFARSGVRLSRRVLAHPAMHVEQHEHPDVAGKGYC